MSARYQTLQNAWNIFILLITIYVIISIPLQLSFHERLFGGLINSHLLTLIFFIDFLINSQKFKRYRKKEECIDFEDKGWFQLALLATDLLAALPFAILFSVPALQLVRLLKLVRSYDIIRNYQHSLIRYASTFTFLSFVLWFILIINGLTCVWFSLYRNGIAPDFLSNYINSFYWVITTLTSVGYGDIVPITNAQKLFAVFVQVLGFGVFSFIIGSVASSLMRKDPATERYRENIEGLSSLMHYKSLPLHLQNRIVDFYKFMWKKRLGYDETVFLHSLPESLQTEVALHLKKEVIEKVSIFNDATDDFKREIALLLKPVFLTPGDYIFKAGDIGEEMYFVVAGELNTLTQTEDRILTRLKAGDYFGEISIIKNQNRSATIKALAYCDVYALDKQSFDKVISKYPKIGNTIKETVVKRESKYSVGK